MNGPLFRADYWVLKAAAIGVPDYADVNRLIKEHHGVPADTWTCDGVRAADSPNRRTSIVTHGAVNQNNRTQKVVWDWKIAHVREAIGAAGVKLPVDYKWFSRSFDGLDRRFLQPIKDNAPDDYATILRWFPFADLELYRAAL